MNEYVKVLPNLTVWIGRDEGGAMLEYVRQKGRKVTVGIRFWPNERTTFSYKFRTACDADQWMKENT